ncbi:B3 domain-containing transcription factor VRN1-like [Rosa rugosa]|uniref:B3 domain-containing transcription factor VRN1-like n=1 Tax=Rosa rugosa TaxID=74645 RepID=UPI002B400C43|nr:B3 domain-containing transcription factor VRN1-like [Rosa rugosa]XP_062001866.1 B3 domain-containing transcription factor VRN1-like [Rosa rugosa]XP_062001872.1 B3 domain-containing transcription factor VRN1-like [Rosa rugosa]
MAPRRKLPSFFKIVPADQFTNKLKIPREFLQHFHGNIPHQCRLQTAARTWAVDLEEVNNKFYFQKGWNEFVQDNGLKYGELLVFHYAGNSDFHVDIFGKNTCGKLFVMPEIEEANEEDDDVSLQISDDSPVSSPPPQKKYKTSSSAKGQMKNKEAHWSKSKMKKKDRVGTSSTQRFTRQKLEPRWRAHVRAEAFKFKNPSAFLVSMKPSYIKYKFVWLPSEFTMLVKPLIENSGYVTLRVSDGRVKTWQAKLTCNDVTTNRSKLHGSWSKFMRDNNLKEGDLCAFMLIKDTTILIEVVIFRTKEAATCTFSPDMSDNEDHEKDDEEDDDHDYNEEGDDENEDEDEEEEEEEDDDDSRETVDYVSSDSS